MAHTLPAPPVATTFSTLFNDTSKDPFLVEGHYDSFLAPFNITVAAGGVNKMPKTVRNHLAAAANQPLLVAVLLLVDGRLRPYFLPFRRDQAMAGCYEGELINSQGTLVQPMI